MSIPPVAANVVPHWPSLACFWPDCRDGPNPALTLYQAAALLARFQAALATLQPFTTSLLAPHLLLLGLLLESFDPLAARSANLLLLLLDLLLVTPDALTARSLAAGLALYLNLTLGLLALFPTFFPTFRALGALSALRTLGSLRTALGLVRLRGTARLAIVIVAALGKRRHGAGGE